MAELTPMMRQYLEIKERHPDCILFFRLGDFYEMFADDAKLASHELDLTLTTRDRGKEKSEQVPMCGVPYHSAESYIARLVARGYKVAICEQMEDPALAKGLVKRDITRIVTPGTVIESSMLDESRNNYFACVFGEDGRYGLSFCDISTGAFYATQAEGAEAMERVISELGRFAPAEVLRGGDAAKSEELTRTLQERLSCCADLGADELFAPQETAQLVEKQFGRPLDELGLTERPEVWRSAGALLRTLCELQKTGLSHVRELEFYVSGRFMELDLSARRNLELTETMRAGEKRGSLLWVLDHTKTAMGSRMLRSWLEKPLLSPKRINARLDAVEELTKNSIGRDELVHMLQDVSDYERVTARIVTGAANCRDLVSLGNGCEPLPELRAAIGGLHASLFGVLLVPLAWCFVRRLTRKPWAAVTAGVLLALDFMRFSQSRLATIDVHGTFFILLGAYCMVWYCQRVLTDGVNRALLPMALGGVAFGLGCAAKWTGIYAGAGLAVLYLGVLYARWQQNRPGFRAEFRTAAVGCFMCCCRSAFTLGPICRTGGAIRRSASAIGGSARCRCSATTRR